MDILLKILAHKRPAGSATEKEIKAWLLSDFNVIEMEGNLVVQVGESRTMFSCHTDTVHRSEGCQPLLYDETSGVVMLDTFDLHSDSGITNCLGADDGAGMWLMYNMIRRGVPGTYVFHHSEEIGGHGSHALSKDTEFMSRFDRAIAFDRRGTGDVITQQRGGRCCSDGFAVALCEELILNGMDYAPAKGIFTDTANYTRSISECTNISCGYYNEHTTVEHMDVQHVAKLLEALVKVEWEKLPTLRDTTPVVELFDDWEFTYEPGLTPYSAAQMTFEELADVCYVQPELAAELIITLLNGENYHENS